jgi:hypothetical protein
MAASIKQEPTGVIDALFLVRMLLLRSVLSNPNESIFLVGWQRVGGRTMLHIEGIRIRTRQQKNNPSNGPDACLTGA